MYEYLVLTKYAETDHLPHDWSVTAWSDIEPISITHKDGRESDSFDFVRRDLSVEAP